LGPDICDAANMARIATQAMSDADGRASKEGKQLACFAVYHLCDIRGALAADEALKAQGEQARFRVRETAAGNSTLPTLKGNVWKRNVFPSHRLDRGSGGLALRGTGRGLRSAPFTTCLFGAGEFALASHAISAGRSESRFSRAAIVPLRLSRRAANVLASIGYSAPHRSNKPACSSSAAMSLSRIWTMRSMSAINVCVCNASRDRFPGSK
jgi:hypothetical protein